MVETPPVRVQSILGLDALRLCAALLVMSYHFFFWEWTRGQTLLPNAFIPPPNLGHLFHFGWIGVEIFFVISGFVITYSAQGATAPRFLRSRVLRLVPAAWICATVSLLLSGFIAKESLSSLAYAYVSTLLFWPFRAIDGVYWTLGIEVSFYALIWGLIRFDRRRLIEPVVYAIGLLSGLFWVAALTLMSVLGTAGKAGILHGLVMHAEGNRILQLGLVQHGCLFALGVAIQATLRRTPSPRQKVLISILVLSCVLEIIGQNSIIERGSQQSLAFAPALVTWLVTMGLFAIAVAYNDQITALLGRKAETLRWFGKLTYPLYLIHNPVGLTAAVLLAPVFGSWALGLAMVAAITAAAVVEAYPERYLRNALGRIVSKWDPGPSASTSVKALRRRPLDAPKGGMTSR